MILIALLTALTDQLAKLVLTGRGRPVISNLGIAFGLLPSPWWGRISLIIIGLMIIWIIKDSQFFNLKLKIGLGLVLGGGLANLVDRWRFGLVRDYLVFRHLPAFNLADLAIVIGVGLIIWQEILVEKVIIRCKPP